MTVTQKINSLLAERGIDKKTFYKDCSISSASYSQWATGKNKPRRERLEQIATYLGVPVEEITGEREKPSPITEDGLSDLQRALINSAVNWSDRTVVLVMQIANELEASRNRQGDSQSTQ